MRVLSIFPRAFISHFKARRPLHANGEGPGAKLGPEDRRRKLITKAQKAARDDPVVTVFKVCSGKMGFEVRPTGFVGHNTRWVANGESRSADFTVNAHQLCKRESRVWFATRV